MEQPDIPSRLPSKFPSAGVSGAPFTAVNGAALLVTIVLGTWATVHADLFPNSTLGEKRVSLAAAWLVSAFLILLVIGHNEKAPAASPWQRAQWGAALLKRNVGYAFMILFMSAASGWCLYGKLVSEVSTGYAGGSLLKGLVASAERTERLAEETKLMAGRAAEASESTRGKADLILERTARIEGSLIKPFSPREVLAKQGVAWNARTFTEALMMSDAQVLDLFVRGGWEITSSTGYGDGGNSLGLFAALAPVTDEASTVRVLKVLRSKLNLIQPVARFRGLPPMNLASVAVYLCNAPMVHALWAAGVDTRVINRPRIFNQFGTPVELDPIKKISQWAPRDDIIGRGCSVQDRKALLHMSSPAVFR